MAKHHGYSGKILRIDLSSAEITHMPTMDYADRFVGGRGIAAKLYWDEVLPEVKAFDPENLLIFMTGPLAGISGVGGSRWEICGKSAIADPEQFCYCSLAGRWGVQLKLAGYDGIAIRGKSDKPVYLFIQGGSAEIRDASNLWGKTASETQEILKGELGSTAAVVACGPAGENRVTYAILLADNDASGGSGFGAVMGSKRLKAIAVRGSGKVTAANPEKVRQLAKHIRQQKEGVSQPEIGLVAGPKMKRDICAGCGVGCWRETFEAADGKKGKYMCGSALFYQGYARRYYREWNEVPFHANRLCDAYGLDVFPILLRIYLLNRCYREGILSDENTGIPISKIGSLEFIETLVKKISLRDGIGDVLAQGPLEAADLLGGRALRDYIRDYVMKADNIPAHDPRLYITTGLLYAMEPRPLPSQDSEVTEVVVAWLNWFKKREGAYVSSEVLRGIANRFWGSELAVDYTTYEGKPLAAVKIQNRVFIRESLILCSFLWPITMVKNSENHIGDPTLESKVFSAVTGKEVDEEGLYRTGEVIFNLQRAIHAREGHRGRESDVLPEEYHTRPGRFVTSFNPECLVPGKGNEGISRKDEVVDRKKFEQMKDEYYQLRGWDVATGLQTKTKLRELGLGDMVSDLEQRGLVV